MANTPFHSSRVVKAIWSCCTFVTMNWDDKHRYKYGERGRTPKLEPKLMRVATAVACPRTDKGKTSPTMSLRTKIAFHLVLDWLDSACPAVKSELQMHAH